MATLVQTHMTSQFRFGPAGGHWWPTSWGRGRVIAVPDHRPNMYAFGNADGAGQLSSTATVSLADPGKNNPKVVFVTDAIWGDNVQKMSDWLTAESYDNVATNFAGLPRPCGRCRCFDTARA